MRRLWRQLSLEEALCSVVLTPKDPHVWLHREAAVALGCATCEGAAAGVGFEGAGCARLWDLMERRCLGLGRLVASQSHQDFPCPRVSVPVGFQTNALDRRYFRKTGDLQTEMSGPQVVQTTTTGSCTCFAMGRDCLHPWISAREYKRTTKLI